MKLKKLIEKEYNKNNQQMLYVTTTTEWYWRPKNRCKFDIILTDKKGEEFGYYIFEIQNLKNFFDSKVKAEWSYCRSFNRKKEDFYNSSLLVESAHQPFYINGVFTLKKFENITKEDIYNCTKYLVNKVLDCFSVWNIRVVIPPKHKE